MENLKSQRKVALPLYGALLGYDFIADAPFGASVRRLVYILKAEKQPIVWVFYYYCPKDAWFLLAVALDDSLKVFNGDGKRISTRLKRSKGKPGQTLKGNKALERAVLSTYQIAQSVGFSGDFRAWEHLLRIRE